jgi:F-type H+-transporting ATPase subunit delta
VKVGIVGKRYASALFQLAVEADSVESIGKDIADFAASIKQSRQLQTVFENPVYGAETRRRIIADLAQSAAMSPLVRNLLLLLSDRRRMRFVDEIADCFQMLAEERSGKVRAEVTVAAELPESYFSELGRTLQAVTGKQVVVEKRVDPSIIGGVVARIGDQVFDGSIRNRLSELREELRSNTETIASGPE